MELLAAAVLLLATVIAGVWITYIFCSALARGRPPRDYQPSALSAARLRRLKRIRKRVLPGVIEENP
jgi:hypothetical protein